MFSLHDRTMPSHFLLKHRKQSGAPYSLPPVKVCFSLFHFILLLYSIIGNKVRASRRQTLCKSIFSFLFLFLRTLILSKSALFLSFIEKQARILPNKLLSGITKQLCSLLQNPCLHQKVRALLSHNIFRKFGRHTYSFPGFIIPGVQFISIQVILDEVF